MMLRLGLKPETQTLSEKIEWLSIMLEAWSCEPSIFSGLCRQANLYIITKRENVK